MSLLQGATAPNHTIPAGWTEVLSQGFEGGIDVSKEFINASITIAQKHSGTKSVGGQISGDGGGVRWVLLQGNHTSREVYVSYWDYMSATATFNDEHFQNLFKITNSAGFQHVYWDWYYRGDGAFNAPAGNLIIVSEGVGPGELHKAFWESSYAPAAAPQRGQWAQFEAHFKANTPGLSDGFFRGYVNGVQRVNQNNRNFNGSIEMRGMSVQIGGTYTKHIWRKGDGSIGNACGAYIGDGVGRDRMTDWTKTYDCGPVPPIFSRYFDDIIVMVPTGSAGGGGPVDLPAGPPTTPIGLAVN